jgi:hypothetical protein
MPATDSARVRGDDGAARVIDRVVHSRSWLPPLIVALAVYLVVGASVGTQVGRTGDPAALIVPGQDFVAPALLPPDAHVFQGAGYDGQFFFYLAQDPLLTGKAAGRDDLTSPYVDHIAYRYQRILLPALGWLTSWGHPRLLEWTLPMINLFAVLAAGFLLARFLAARGRSPWLSLVYMLSLGVLAGFANDLSDPLAASLFVAAVIWWVEERPAAAIAALTACLLTRELYLIPVASVIALELVRRRQRGLAWLIPLGVFAAWQVYLRVALASPVVPDVAARPSPIPLLGAARKVHAVLKSDYVGAANWEVLFVALLLLLAVYFAVRSLRVLDWARHARKLPDRERLLPLVALASVATVPFLTKELWNYIPSYARYGAPAAGMLVLLYAVARDRPARWLMLALMVLTLTNPVVALLPISNAPSVQIPAPPK